jgi:hypothetical protein
LRRGGARARADAPFSLPRRRFASKRSKRDDIDDDRMRAEKKTEENSFA